MTLPADPWGRLDLDGCRELVRRERPALVTVAHGSNVNGVVQDLGALRELLGEIPLLVDAAQTAGVLPIDVEKLGIDFLSCSAHKGLLGPTGVGACYLNPKWEVAPLLEGGTGSRSESWEHPTVRPDRYEAGTLNLHGIAGTLAALEVLRERGLSGEHKRELARQLFDRLSGMANVHIHSPSDGSALCVSLAIEGLRPDEAALRLEEEFGVLCRPGLQCAPAAHRHLRTFPAGTVRLSPGVGNTSEDIEIAARGVHTIAQGSKVG
jgi:selenocysteine lyase/cysteine desulfurase